MLKASAVRIIVALHVIVAGCYYDKQELLYPGSIVNCDTIKARFTDVQPIIATKCATTGCHDPSAAAGNTILQTYEQVSAKANRIYSRVVIEKSMPPVPSLSTSEIAVLKCWINSGAPQN